jgi:hypothetical protein
MSINVNAGSYRVRVERVSQKTGKVRHEPVSRKLYPGLQGAQEVAVNAQKRFKGRPGVTEIQIVDNTNAVLRAYPCKP